jgi:UDP-glucose 4-epimerase
MFADKTLMITGGTGSFGNAVLRRFLETDIREIRIFSRDEKKQFDMYHQYRKNPKLKFFIGDVRDYESIDGAMGGVDYVFSAAALKQVPSCESNPMQAVYTNVIGTQNVLTSAEKNGVTNVVVLSTDKAVYPINAMGMSKAMMEKITIAKSLSCGSNITMCNTRYGNVMASRGSVIPFFVDKIKAGETVPITDPEMTRFMMSLEDAVDLVLFAFEHGKNGDTFVQKAPACTIETLAIALDKIFGKMSKKQIIGPRYGEKKHETLVNEFEMSRADDLDNFFRINTELLPHEVSEDSFDYTSENTERFDVEQMINILLKLPYIRESLR